MVVAEKDREKLTVAPPIRLDAGSFTEEELSSWGCSNEETEDIWTPKLENWVMKTW